MTIYFAILCLLIHQSQDVNSLNFTLDDDAYQISNYQFFDTIQHIKFKSPELAKIFNLALFNFSLSVDQYLTIRNILGQVYRVNDLKVNLETAYSIIFINGTRSINQILDEPNGLWWNLSTYYYFVLPRLSRNLHLIFERLWIEHSIFMRQIMSFNVANYKLINRFIRNRIKNLYGYPMKVVMFAVKQKAIKMKDGTFTGKKDEGWNFTGTDGLLLQLISNHMNFTPIITEPPDGNRYGWRSPDGNFTGMLGELINSRAEMGFNSIFIKNYHTTDIAFTTAFDVDDVCLVVPKSDLKPEWQGIFLAFDETTWLLIVLTYFVCVIVWYYIKSVIYDSFDHALLVLNVFQAFILAPLHQVPKYYSEKMIFLSILLFTLVISNSFQGSLVRLLTHPIYEPDINSLADLDESGLPIRSTANNLRETFETYDNGNVIYRNLFNKFVFTPDKSENILTRISYRRDAAGIVRKNIATQAMKNYIKDDKVLLHIVPECPISYNLALMFKKQSLYIHVINDIILLLVQSGILNSYYITNTTSIIHVYNQHKHHQIFTINNVYIAFIILMLGYTLALMVFLFEYCCVHISNRRCPMYCTTCNALQTGDTKATNKDSLKSKDDNLYLPFIL
ncbi:hypothetical protein M8J76_013165 [Diaphorina citri]|nr:hypothetical protein M8J76_013165 [Diaphorina citri]